MNRAARRRKTWAAFDAEYVKRSLPLNDELTVPRTGFVLPEVSGTTVPTGWSSNAPVSDHVLVAVGVVDGADERFTLLLYQQRAGRAAFHSQTLVVENVAAGLSGRTGGMLDHNLALEDMHLDIAGGRDLHAEFRPQVNHLAFRRLHLKPAGLRAEDFGRHLARLEAHRHRRGQVGACRALQDDLHSGVKAEFHDARGEVQELSGGKSIARLIIFPGIRPAAMRHAR